MNLHKLITASAILSCLFGQAAMATESRAAGYVDLADTTLVVPRHEVFACSADGWLISMTYEIRTSVGPVTNNDIAMLEDTVAQALADNITAHNHDMVTITPGSAFRRNVLGRIHPVADVIDNRNSGGTVHIGLNDGKYLDMCPVS